MTLVGGVWNGNSTRVLKAAKSLWLWNPSAHTPNPIPIQWPQRSHSSQPNSSMSGLVFSARIGTSGCALCASIPFKSCYKALTPPPITTIFSGTAFLGCEGKELQRPGHAKVLRSTNSSAPVQWIQSLTFSQEASPMLLWRTRSLVSTSTLQKVPRQRVNAICLPMSVIFLKAPVIPTKNKTKVATSSFQICQFELG